MADGVKPNKNATAGAKPKPKDSKGAPPKGQEGAKAKPGNEKKASEKAAKQPTDQTKKDVDKSIKPVKQESQPREETSSSSRTKSTPDLISPFNILNWTKNYDSTIEFYQKRAEKSKIYHIISTKGETINKGDPKSLTNNPQTLDKEITQVTLLQVYSQALSINNDAFEPIEYVDLSRINSDNSKIDDSLFLKYVKSTVTNSYLLNESELDMDYIRNIRDTIAKSKRITLTKKMIGEFFDVFERSGGNFAFNKDILYDSDTNAEVLNIEGIRTFLAKISQLNPMEIYPKDNVIKYLLDADQLIEKQIKLPMKEDIDVIISKYLEVALYIYEDPNMNYFTKAYAVILMNWLHMKDQRVGKVISGILGIVYQIMDMYFLTDLSKDTSIALTNSGYNEIITSLQPLTNRYIRLENRMGLSDFVGYFLTSDPINMDDKSTLSMIGKMLGRDERRVTTKSNKSYIN